MGPLPPGGDGARTPARAGKWTHFAVFPLFQGVCTGWPGRCNWAPRTRSPRRSTMTHLKALGILGLAAALVLGVGAGAAHAMKVGGAQGKAASNSDQSCANYAYG